MTLTCPHCHQRYVQNVGALMGAQHSERKAQAARENGRKGGDPRKFRATQQQQKEQQDNENTI